MYTCNDYSEKVWILFVVSTVIFIISTTILIIMQERCDVTNKNNTSPIRKVVYKQFEYVLTIIASQGETFSLKKLMFSIKKNNNM